MIGPFLVVGWLGMVSGSFACGVPATGAVLAGGAVPGDTAVSTSATQHRSATGTETSVTPILKEAGVYFTSDRVTVAGMGPGAGVVVWLGRRVVAEGGATVLWANGNAVATRAGIGLQRDGRWAPAAFLEGGLLWGQRTELLSSSGARPASPVWIAGARVAPLRFRGTRGYVSALELAWGVGAYGGRSIGVTVLAAGIRL